ncbi:MAG: hypothetical protein KatS3mg027_1785 [Bacteroidia bacterium]|nr:MAG: hypothetical protein KatS3mg027_1785 [Bacteroidia bacterium]
MKELFTKTRIKTTHYLISVVLLSLSYLNILAQIPEKPNPPRLYNNFSKEFPNFLAPDEAEAIEQKLEKFSRETSNQIAVVVCR